jgi:hypothetical protein
MEPPSTSEDPCVLPLRQEKELPQAPLVPVQRSGRRLAMEQDLVSAARSASPKATLHAVKLIRADCEMELLTICKDQVLLVQEVNRVTNSNVHSPLMVEALRNVHGCLAANSEALSPACLATLVSEILESTKSAAPRGRNAGGARKNHGHHRTAVRRHKDDQDEKDSSEDVGGTTEGLLYGIGNMEEKVTPTQDNGRIDQWDHGNHRRHHHRAHRDEGVHPLVWVVVLPFFCLGVFVTMKRAVMMYRQRRGYASLGAAKHCEYAPLKAHDNPPQCHDV